MCFQIFGADFFTPEHVASDSHTPNKIRLLDYIRLLPVTSNVGYR